MLLYCSEELTTLKFMKLTREGVQYIILKSSFLVVVNIPKPCEHVIKTDVVWKILQVPFARILFSTEERKCVV